MVVWGLDCIFSQEVGRKGLAREFLASSLGGELQSGDTPAPSTSVRYSARTAQRWNSTIHFLVQGLELSMFRFISLFRLFRCHG